TATWRLGTAEERPVKAANAAANRSPAALAPGLSTRSTEAPLLKLTCSLENRNFSTRQGPATPDAARPGIAPYPHRPALTDQSVKPGSGLLTNVKMRWIVRLGNTVDDL